MKQTKKSKNEKKNITKKKNLTELSENNWSSLVIFGGTRLSKI
jgi:hypothetical protein